MSVMSVWLDSGAAIVWGLANYIVLVISLPSDLVDPLINKVYP